MALTFTSDQITNKELRPAATPSLAGVIYCVQSKATVTDALTTNNLVGLVELPPYAIPVECIVDCDDLDTATAMIFDVGILDTATTDLVASSLLIDGSVAGQTGAIARMDDYECAFEPATWLAETDCPDISEPKIVAMKVMTAAGTPAAGDIYTTVFYRSSMDDV